MSGSILGFCLDPWYLSRSLIPVSILDTFAAGMYTLSVTTPVGGSFTGRDKQHLGGF